MEISGAFDIGGGFIQSNSTMRFDSRMALVVGGGAEVRVPDAVPWIGGTSIASGSFLFSYLNDLALANDWRVAAFGVGKDGGVVERVGRKVVTATLGNGQKIEIDMATDLGL